MKTQLKQIWQYAQSVIDANDDLPEPPELTVISKDNVEKTIAKLTEVLGSKRDINKKARVKLNYINRNFPKNIQNTRSRKLF
ncbi:hypothetical protein I5M32_01200 [Pedobacter sp. SD-b]|uniref:Uncharacterized protein n=1 Tax=Pedobacter segetis TaxID=2793069 RepID=A0ABS1BFD2_9SPHI|nr:hypothetical protein [Pedobacter segetis]MBK0381563.1 hypothetical protein [Pedobacter segetis]